MSWVFFHAKNRSFKGILVVGFIRNTSVAFILIGLFFVHCWKWVTFRWSSLEKERKENFVNCAVLRSEPTINVCKVIQVKSSQISFIAWKIRKIGEASADTTATDTYYMKGYYNLEEEKIKVKIWAIKSKPNCLCYYIYYAWSYHTKTFQIFREFNQQYDSNTS